MTLEAIAEALLDDIGTPLSDKEYAEIYEKFVVEDSVYHLTWDVVSWIMSPEPGWKLIRIRYEYEKIIPGAHGKDLFLEVTYQAIDGSEFPHATFYFRPLVNWHVYFVDFVTIRNLTKVMIRIVKNEDRNGY